MALSLPFPSLMLKLPSDTLRREGVAALSSCILQISPERAYLPALLPLTKTRDYWQPIILVETFSFRWDLADIACQMFSMVSVPIYDTHGAEGCLHIIVHGNACYSLRISLHKKKKNVT